jgi:serine/threonine-protein kinase RsbT
VSDDIHVAIRSDIDIVTARHQGRTLAAQIGFTATDATLIATAISELARNIVLYAKHGEIILRRIENLHTRGMMIVADDSGPGISNIQNVMRDGYSTSGGLGLGLPGVKRLMDEFGIDSQLGTGTTITIKKWLR